MTNIHSVGIVNLSEKEKTLVKLIGLTTDGKNLKTAVCVGEVALMAPMEFQPAKMLNVGTHCTSKKVH